MLRLLTWSVLSMFALSTHGATFTVSNTADLGPGSLRQAILGANANPGLDVIDFSIGSGPQRITVPSPLVVTSPLTIDGATQEGFAGTPLVTLVGTGSGYGLVLEAGADGSAVRNLEFGRFLGSSFTDGAIAITGANGVTVAGNYLGAVRGDEPLQNGLAVRVHTDGNIIGGLTAAERNVGVNTIYDVRLESTADGNVIQGNFFGFDPTGLIGQFPAFAAVAIHGGSNNVVGGPETEARNVIRAHGRAIVLADGAQGNRVQGNYLGLNANGAAAGPYLPNAFGISMSDTGGGNLIGGSNPGSRNVITGCGRGISISNGGAERIIGNFIGTNPAGTAAIPNGIGIFVQATVGPGPLMIGGPAAGEGNVISGSTQAGIDILSDFVVVQSNFIGTTANGLAAVPNEIGIRLRLFGASIGTGNVISGNRGAGIQGNGAIFAAGDAIHDNFIGVAPNGTTPVPNGGDGIDLTGPAGAGLIELNVIADNARSGIRFTNIDDFTIVNNTIRNNQGDGVAIAGTGLRNVVSVNAIADNSGLGIDLADDGVTPNDAGDTDAGPNALQNWPVLTRAFGGGDSVTVFGILLSTPNTGFTIDFYASPSADPSGSGEGARFVGRTIVMTGPTGEAPFDVNVAASAAGEVITATATGATSGTSEFSNAVVVASSGTLQFSAPTYSTVEGTPATLTVTRTGGTAGTITVQYATGGGTATAGGDYTAASGTLLFNEGQTTAIINIPTTANAAAEGDETVQVTLSNVSGGATLGSPSQATVTIGEAPGAVAVPTLGEIAATLLVALLAFVAVRSLQLT